MGNPNTGEIYELADGEDPKPGDVRLTGEQAARLSELTADVRKLELQAMRSASIELPLYKCHKEVRGFKVTDIEYSADGSARLVSGESLSVWVDAKYVGKHEPKVGGYYVQYKDGYESWSPAEAFEDGYTRIESA